MNKENEKPTFFLKLTGRVSIEAVKDARIDVVRHTVTHMISEFWKTWRCEPTHLLVNQAAMKYLKPQLFRSEETHEFMYNGLAVRLYRDGYRNQNDLIFRLTNGIDD